MAKAIEKNHAIELRRNGSSIKEISLILGIPKSTISLWCRDVVLTTVQAERLAQKMRDSGHAGRLIGAAVNRKKKECAILDAKKWAEQKCDHISRSEFFVAGIALYWAEGSKSYDNQLSFINSDPAMIIFMYKWLKTFFNVTSSEFVVRVYINDIHRERIGRVLNFWSDLLDLSQECFRKTVFVKTKQRKVYSNHDSYYGQLSLRVKKSSNLRYKILALMDRLRNADVAQVARASHS